MHIFCINFYLPINSFFFIRAGNRYVLFRLEKGKRYWKLNFKLLECKEYKLHVNTLIKDINKMLGSHIDKWEVLYSSNKDFFLCQTPISGYTKNNIPNIENELNEIENLPTH